MNLITSPVKALLSTTSSKRDDSDVASVARDAGHAVHSFNELQDAVARVSYYNAQHDIFLRGQRSDHRDAKGHSSLIATLFRATGRDAVHTVKSNIDKLTEVSSRLKEIARGRPGFKAVQTTEYVQWALLQHYELCPTPVLDMTRSTRVAASFATWPTKSADPPSDRFVYVLGMPHPHGSLTVAYNENIALLNLRNLTPPQARRPHWQEGYLACSFPASTHWDRYDADKKTGLDLPGRHNFARRLLAKLRIPAGSLAKFWDDANPRLPNELLMPADDPVKQFLTEQLVAPTA